MNFKNYKKLSGDAPLENFIEIKKINLLLFIVKKINLKILLFTMQ